MAMVLQANRVTSSSNSSSTSSTVPMDSYNQLPQSTNQEDSFHRKIFDKIEEAKRDKDPEKCQQILDDLMKMLKHLTTDVNNYNLAFRETRPPFYMQVSAASCWHSPIARLSIKEFQRLTDRIDTLTKARDTLTEYLHELEDRSVETTLPRSASANDLSSMQAQYSPTASPSARSSPPEKAHYQHTSSSSSIHSGTNDHHPSASNDNYLMSPSLPTHSSHQSRSHSMTPSNFIRVHFPNKHTTAVSSPTSNHLLVRHSLEGFPSLV